MGRIIFLGCPGHGRTIDYGTAKGMLAMPSRGGDFQVYPKLHKSSILPQTFNYLLAEALTAKALGQGITHFAMIHADIEPEPFWLDKAWDIMKRTGGAVVSVVSPIKDRCGLTSTGCYDKSDPEQQIRRLTLTEVHERMPETFSAEDLPWENHALVVNTGLMLVDLDGPWFVAGKDGRLPVRFRIESEIVVHPSGKHFANAEPEDWLFSKDMAAYGAKVVATRGIKLTHWDGATPYSNDKWGEWDTDKAAESIKAKGYFNVADNGRRFPADVEGWLSEAEGRALAAHAKGKDVLEIGSFCGRSTICLAQAAKRVVAVDTFDSRSTLKERLDTRQAFEFNLKRYAVTEKVVIRQGTSEEVIPTLKDKFDFVFIDGAHDYESVKRDAELATSVLKPGGLLGFHDYRLKPGPDGRWDPGVTKAVDELYAAGAGTLGCWDSLAIVRPATAK